MTGCNVFAVAGLLFVGVALCVIAYVLEGS